MDYSADTPLARPKAACPVCSSRTEADALFCARCGAFLGEDNGKRPQKRGKASGIPPDDIDHGMVQLMGEIAHLQRDLLRQFRQGQALQVRQFERALQAQALGLEKTLAHTAERVEASEARLDVWRRWTAGLAAAVFVLLVIGSQIV
jgi:hypothetical protein